jgi:hypothetical protein
VHKLCAAVFSFSITNLKNDMPTLYHLQIFHQFLYVVLDQSLQLLEADTNSTVGEALAMVASQLIATAALDDR